MQHFMHQPVGWWEQFWQHGVSMVEEWLLLRENV